MPTDQNILKIREDAAKLKQMYLDDPRQNSFNLLLCGETGSGKSHLATTCPAPVHMDVFESSARE